jgi:PAS domain S-box-containing protein
VLSTFIAMPDTFSVLFDHSPNPMWVYEIPTLRILKVNEAAITAYGYTEQEFLAMAISDIREQFDPSKTNDYLVGPTTPFANAGVLKHLNKKGEVICAEVSSYQVPYEKYNCRTLIAIDVTDKIKAQKEINIREQFLNSLIDSQTNFLIRINTEGNYTFANRQFLKVLGYKSGEIVGKHFSFTSLPNDLANCEKAFIKCITHPGKVIHHTHTKVDRAGELHDTQWEFISVTNEDGEVTEIQGIGQDITHKKKTEEEMALTQTNLEGLIDNTDDLIWSVDSERRYVYMNKAYKKAVLAHTGITPVRGEYHHSAKYTDSYGEPLINEWRTYYDRAFSGEKYLITKQGLNYTPDNPIYYETYFNPIYATSGEIIGVGCFSRNISERLKTEKALINQNSRLKQIATLSSHDLRRPVASMLGLINIIDKNNFSNPANKEVIDHLFTTSTEIDTVIRQIVDNTFTTDLNIGYGTLKEKED